MQLRKDEALLMRSVIFAFLLKDRDAELYESLQTLLQRLDDFLLLSHTEDCLDDHEKTHEDVCENAQDNEKQEECHETHDDLDEETVSENEQINVDKLIPPVVLHDLPPLEFNHKGETLHLEFEDIDAEDSVDVLIDDDFEFGAVALKLEKGQLHLFSSLENDEESHVYSYIKLPKKWSKTFELGKLYGVGAIK